MYISFHRNTSTKRWWFRRIPISQAFLWLGPILVHMAWGISAQLIKSYVAEVD